MKITSITALLLMLALCSGSLHAQEAIEQMNEIKLSGAYLTAEVTSSDIAQAFSSALLTLVDKTNQLRSEQGREAVSEAQVRAKAQRLDIPRGSSTMVFVYLAKAEVGNLSAATGSSSTVSLAASSSNSPVASSSGGSSSGTSSTNVSSSAASSSNVASSTGTTSSDVSSSAAASSDVASSSGVASSSAATSSPEGNSSSFSYTPTVSAESNRLIAKLKEVEVFSSVVYLLRQHAYDNPSFVYGRADKVGNTDNCYVVLVNEQRYVVALLTPSSHGVRNNVKTMQPCSISDYPGCAAIYFRAK